MTCQSIVTLFTINLLLILSISNLNIHNQTTAQHIDKSLPSADELNSISARDKENLSRNYVARQNVNQFASSSDELNSISARDKENLSRNYVLKSNDQALPSSDELNSISARDKENLSRNYVLKSNDQALPSADELNSISLKDKSKVVKYRSPLDNAVSFSKLERGNEHKEANEVENINSKHSLYHNHQDHYSLHDRNAREQNNYEVKIPLKQGRTSQPLHEAKEIREEDGVHRTLLLQRHLSTLDEEIKVEDQDYGRLFITKADKNQKKSIWDNIKSWFSGDNNKKSRSKHKNIRVGDKNQSDGITLEIVKPSKKN